MALDKDFETFCKDIVLDNLSDIEKSTGEIAKKLNSVYYDLESDTSSHMYIVGSVGRHTAIKGSSDLDLIFDLPESVYKKYNNYDSNGQTALLQEIKEVLLERYPKTEMSADGQVVVIGFNKFTVELVPGFLQDDNSFKYPDSHDGGKWKITKPIDEQNECERINDESSGKFYKLCHLIRAWKNNIGFDFGGLLIDTLVYNCFTENNSFIDESDLFNIFKSVLLYLKDCIEEQDYWLAVGSNQRIYDKGKFIKKAATAYNKIKKAEENDEDINIVLRTLLGNNFPNSVRSAYIMSIREPNNKTEQFVEDLFIVDVRYYIELECKVSQNGFRDMLLTKILSTHGILRKNKSLDFYIRETNCPEPYDIYWKVRNVGLVAVEKNCIRGQIKKTNNKHQKEHTDFQGEHFVECYLVRNNICIARGHIDVPISNM